MAKVPTELNLAVVCTIAPKLLIQMLCRFRASHPEVQVQLEERSRRLGVCNGGRRLRFRVFTRTFNKNDGIFAASAR
jgi:DNA-binding transcriptional LysR family regulator